MDRNSIIGFALMLLIAGGYFFWANHEQKEAHQQAITDSLAKAANQKTIAATDTNTVHLADSAKAAVANAATDSLTPAVFKGTPAIKTINNGKLMVAFSTKGGQPISATLDSFQTYKSRYITKDGKKLQIFSGDSNSFAFKIPYNGKTISTSDLYFTPQESVVDGGAHQLRMTATLPDNKVVELSYTLPANGYMMMANLHLIGFQQDLSQAKTFPLNWKTQALHTEKDLKNEHMNGQVHFRYHDGKHDYFTIQRTDHDNIERAFDWFGVRTQFFNSTIIADKPFTSGSFKGALPKDSSLVVANSTVLNIPIQASNDFNFGFRWYMGPNDYNILKSYKIDMEEMIPLGYGLFSFVKYITKWMIIPLFDVLSRFITNFGVIIICITLIIRFLLSFFTYKSYLSSAKMRVLKPELDELRAKYGDDKQQFGMEQMKLYRTAGVNPIGGCLPMLLQMPFLLSMYYFFPTAIQLRQSHFLWQNDLSTYDSILNLGFNIPFYGNHVSLFTLLMTATSLFLAVYNKNMTAGAAGNDPNMAMMKWMPYVMPFMFLGWFNSMAAGLSFYYTCSNIISIIQQYVIKRFFINEEAIHQKMKDNKNKPKGGGVTSKWQEKMEAMQKAQLERAKQNKK